MSARNGGTAYPSLEIWTNDGDQLAHAPNGEVVAPGCATSIHHPGMSLRDYFAAKATLMAYYAESAAPTHGGTLGNPTYQGIAARAYLMADAMLKARAA